MPTEIVKVGESQLERSMTDLVRRTREVVVTDKDTCLIARMIEKEWDLYIKQVGFEFDEGIEKAKSTWQHLKDQKEKWAGPAKVERESIKSRADIWSNEEKRRTKLEEDRANAELARQQKEKADSEKKEAEDLAAKQKKERIAEINRALKAGEIGKREASKRLKEAGAAAEAAIQDAAVKAEEMAAAPPRVEVKPNLPKVAGKKNQTYYYAEITDQTEILHELLTTKDMERRSFLATFIMVDPQMVGQFARDTKDEMKAAQMLPGVRFWSVG